jgi:hypothetical protein
MHCVVRGEVISAKRAILAVVIVYALLTCNGMTPFVVASGGCELINALNVGKLATCA